MEKARIIAVLSSKENGVFQSVHKYINLINNLFADNLGSSFFIEDIPNGLIYFFKDLALYNAMILPYNKKNVNEYLQQEDKKFSPELLRIPKLREEPFPKEGITAIYKIIKGPLDKIMEPTIKHFQSYSEKEIKITLKDEKTFEVNFSTYQSIKRYLDERSSLIGGLIKDYMQ